MTIRVLKALGVCIAMAVLETLAAGADVGQRFDELTLPVYSPPMWSWFCIAGLYYATCFFVLYRVFLTRTDSRPWRVPLALVLVLMLANALWNLAFFQPGWLAIAFAVTVAYSLVAAGLLVALWRLDRTTALGIVPYSVYLVYATFWTYGVWQLNGNA